MLAKRGSAQKSSRLIKLVALVFWEPEMVLLGLVKGGVTGIFEADSSSRMVMLAMPWLPIIAPFVGLVSLMLKYSSPSTLLSLRMRMALGLPSRAFWTEINLLTSFSARVKVIGILLKSLLTELAAQPQPFAVPSIKLRVALTSPVVLPLRVTRISVMAVPSSVTV
jgi:hypothetical protein